MTVSGRDDEDEDKPLASKLTKKEKSIAVSPISAQQQKVVEEKAAASINKPPVSTKSKVPLKSEAHIISDAGERVKSKRKQRVTSKLDDDVVGEEAEDDAAIYAASIRRRKAKGGKPVKEEKGQRRSERVKQQAEADIIVLSSDDEEAVVRIKRQTEEREREELRRLQDEGDERWEDDEGEEEDEEKNEAVNLVRPKKERVEVGKRIKKGVKRRLMNEEENLVSSEDSDMEKSHSVAGQQQQSWQ